MLSKNTKKFTVFLLLVILVNTASGASTSIPNTTEEVDKSTTIPIENTTEPASTTQPPSVTEPDTESTTESATEKIECICDCVDNDGNQVKLDCTTQSPEEESQTEPSSNTESGTALPEENTTVNSNNEGTTPTSNTEDDNTIQTTTALPDDVTTVNSNEEDTTPDSNAENNDTTQDTTALPEEEVTTENSNNEDTTTAANTENADTTKAPETTTTEADSTAATTTTTTPAPIACTTPGQRQPHDLDCHQYYECSSESSVDGSFHLLAKSCPEKQAFNAGLNRCSRDISDCTLPIQCRIAGGIADPASNSSYYLCVPRLIGIGFRVFHIDCSSNELYYPLLGKCFIDINNLPTQSFPPPYWNQIRDYDIVKAELKLLKEQDKLILKEQKAQQKAEEKLQKELEKEAKKRAKEEEKANKEKVKQEATTFACVVEGNYPSSVSESTYIACVNKKGKLKALAMQCAYGATFDAQSAVCVNGPAVVNSSASKEEVDDDDDD